MAEEAAKEVKIILTLKNNRLETVEIQPKELMLKPKEELTEDDAYQIETKSSGFRHIADIYFARKNPCYYVFRQGARLYKIEVPCE